MNVARRLLTFRPAPAPPPPPEFEDATRFIGAIGDLAERRLHELHAAGYLAKGPRDALVLIANLCRRGERGDFLLPPASQEEPAA